MLSADAVHAIAALSRAREPFATPDGGQAVVLPKDYALAKVPPIEPPLTHIKQTVSLHDFTSLVSYLTAFKAPSTRVFGEPGFLSSQGQARIVAAIDYHEAPTADRAADAAIPKRLGHVVRYEPRYSEAWQRWTKACSGPLEQSEFAELIEECRADIVEPHAAQLLDIARTFKAAKRVDYDSLTYQPDSGVKLHYSESVDRQGSSAALPELMHIGIPVYYRGERYRQGVFVRFKVGSGGVKFALKLDRADVIEDDAFNDLCTRLAEATTLPVHIGRLA